MKQTTSPIRVAIAGASGKMGQSLISAVANDTNFQLTAAFGHDKSPLFAQDAGMRLGWQSRVQVNDQVEEGLEQAQALIDFTRPEASMSHLAACVKQRTPWVLGTTGFSAEQLKLIQKASESIPIVFSPNMSVGVNAVFAILRYAAKLLGEDADIEILEMHHRHKVDAPSGTALKMGKVISQALNRDFDTNAVLSRQGHTGERKAKTIGFATLRGGDVIGDHSVIFASQGERVEISHRSSNRNNYARGALRAAVFLQDKKNGLFDMWDVLGISKDADL